MRKLVCLAGVVLFLVGCTARGRVTSTAATPTGVGVPTIAAPATALVASTDLPPTPPAEAAFPRLHFAARGGVLAIEVLADDLVHFGYSTTPFETVPVSPLVAKTDFTGPTRIHDDGQGGIETPALGLQVEADTLCFTLRDRTLTPPVTLTHLCPQDLDQAHKALTFTPESMQHVYGLGEKFTDPAREALDWAGRVRRPGNEFGNAMTGFSGGSTGNAQFPVMYALGAQANYALFVDSPYAQTWDFSADPWQVSLAAPGVQGYLLTGPDLPDLRADFMDLVGHPPLPPRQAFGLWVSEYGFDNWAELDDKLRTLRTAHFPVDGFVMDLQWFGGVAEDETTHMGYVSWDTAHFPDPAARIAALRDQEGLGLVLIEESYVGKRTPDYEPLKAGGYLVRKKEGGDPVTLFAWWGFGGYLDWTNPATGDYWHDLKRQPLIEMGILGHWTDLGEPEMFQKDAWYFGENGLHAEPDVHNLYNFRWSESIARGYVRNGDLQRPFILSRSGTAGIQRFGTLLWSGDIGADLVSLAAHFGAQMHLSFSGLDYYGADIGGFHRAAAGDNLDPIYTRWFAAGSLLDVPVRVHTENLCNCKETAPDRVGDSASNLANLRLRYRLIPYLYSLAHRAWLFAEPVEPPLVYYYQHDPAVAQIADEKLLGRDLLVATSAELNAEQRDVYLPAGTWVDFYTQEWIDSPGAWQRGVPLRRDGLFRLPLYARAGAILPLMYVDEQTMNAFGRRLDGSVHDELILRLYAGEGHFTLYEDDGTTIAYQDGAVRTTEIAQLRAEDHLSVKVDAAQGEYDGAPAARDTVLQVVTPALKVGRVTLNANELPRYTTQAAFDAAPAGWYVAGDGLVWVKSGSLAVSQAKEFVFELEK